MNIEFLRSLFDFGLLVLIWLVQLVIYPSFQFYQKENLIKWYKKYTVGISLVVIPLMFGQLITAIFQLFKDQSIFTIGSMVLIGLVWAITFVQFTPIHVKLSAGQGNEALLQRLTNRNWWRTLLWTLIFIWTFLTTL